MVTFLQDTTITPKLPQCPSWLCTMSLWTPLSATSSYSFLGFVSLHRYVPNPCQDSPCQDHVIQASLVPAPSTASDPVCLGGFGSPPLPWTWDSLIIHIVPDPAPGSYNLKKRSLFLKQRIQASVAQVLEARKRKQQSQPAGSLATWGSTWARPSCNPQWPQHCQEARLLYDLFMWFFWKTWH
jgi:hypothetical protein